MNQFGLGCNWFGGAAGIPRRGVWLGKVSTILAGFFLMGIGKMIEGNKKRLRVPRKSRLKKMIGVRTAAKSSPMGRRVVKSSTT